MSLIYRIHWVDDNLENANSVMEGVNLKFHDVAVTIEAEIVEDGDDIEEVARSSSLDLFVLDYNLDTRNGDELISSLRLNGELTEIVFYSQDPEVYDRCVGVEGVFPCERDGAQAEIISVIEKFLDRNKTISVMRGIIISEAIDLENKLTDIILAMFEDKAELFRLKILNKPIMDFSKKYFFVQSVLKDKLKAEREQEDGGDLHLIQRMVDVEAILKGMRAEIIDQRNILAHASKTFEDGVLVLSPLIKDGSPIKFNDEWKNVVRENIRKHTRNIAELRNILIG